MIRGNPLAEPPSPLLHVNPSTPRLHVNRLPVLLHANPPADLLRVNPSAEHPSPMLHVLRDRQLPGSVPGTHCLLFNPRPAVLT